MIKKIIRGLLTVFGAAFGYGVCRLLGYGIERSGVDIDIAFTDSERLFFEVLFAIIFALIFFRMTPALGRQSTKVAVNIENDLQGISASRIIGGTVGLIAGLVIAFLLTQMFGFVTNEYFYAIIVIASYTVLGFLGTVIGSSKQNEILSGIRAPKIIAEQSTKKSGKKKSDAIPKILDTSVIIDGRIADIMTTGFLEGPIVIPDFVLVELRHIADSSDSLKRVRGRRGLDILKKMQNDYDVEIYSSEGEKALKEIPEVDVKLLKLAQLINGKVVTNDYNLNKVAAINSVEVLNINKLANCLKPVVLPGEEMTVDLVKQGKDPSQAIGYLDDGTMIVAEDGRKMIGKTTKINVTSVLQTSAGRMIFGRLKN